MSNTTVTIKYSNGEEREFVASDELEKMIDEGYMFSVTTMHSDIGRQEEESVSKMYAGNPMGALGNMLKMRTNCENMSDEDEDGSDTYKKIIIDILTVSVKFLSDEITSHQSGMTPSLERNINGDIEPSKLN